MADTSTGGAAYRDDGRNDISNKPIIFISDIPRRGPQINLGAGAGARHAPAGGKPNSSAGLSTKMRLRVASLPGPRSEARIVLNPGFCCAQRRISKRGCPAPRAPASEQSTDGA